jgi:quercetin dioxygenase-like cupin family protein
MNSLYTYIPDLSIHLDVPPDGILSRTLRQDEHRKTVLFGFGAGQELSEHTSSLPAIIHLITGEARLTLGAEVLEAKAGAWAPMPPLLPHRVYAKTPLVMLLVLLKTAKAQPQAGQSGQGIAGAC